MWLATVPGDTTLELATMCATGQGRRIWDRRAIHSTRVRLSAILAVVALLVLAPASAGAQDPGTIAGRVTDQHGAPLEGVDVLASNFELGTWGAYTDADGRYEITGLPAGSWIVRWWELDIVSAGNLRYYDGAWSQQDATPVTVVAGGHVGGIDGVLLVPPLGDGAISGRVTDQAGRPLERICVGASNHENGGFGSTETAVDGTYVIAELPASREYVVRFGDCHGPLGGSGRAEFYDDAPDVHSADPVAVVDGQVTGGIDAELEVPGSITGRVTDQTGAAMPHICVWLLTPSGDGAEEPSAFTDADGRYRVGGVETGSYLVGFEDCGGSGARGELWDDARRLQDADLVEVTFGEETGGIDAELDRPLFAGWGRRLTDPPALIDARAGSVVALAFGVGGDFGLDFLRFSTYSWSTDCADPGTVPSELVETRSIGDRGFTYHHRTGVGSGAVPAGVTGLPPPAHRGRVRQRGDGQPHVHRAA